jgi:hypothetical protein
MHCPLVERIRRSRGFSTMSVLAITMSLVLTGTVAQARVEPSGGRNAAVLDQNAVAKATGGGTVLAKPTYMSTVASFGINARRPATGGPSAEGRINYDRHNNTTDRHVNVPVLFMEASPVPQGPNQTGGEALLIGDCDAPGAQCPAGDHSAIVYAKDVSDSGKGQDVFNIYFCTSTPGLPGTFVPNAPITDCEGPEGDTLRSGNIQVRGDAAVAGEIIGTAAGSGAYTMTPNVNGVELSGGTFGVGARTAGPGDIEANLNGVQPLLGLFQQLTISGWVTSASANNGTMTFSGTASLDMGDGSPVLTGLALSGSLSATGLTLTVGSWSFGTLPMQDGFIKIE